MLLNRLVLRNRVISKRELWILYIYAVEDFISYSIGAVIEVGWAGNLCKEETVGKAPRKVLVDWWEEEKIISTGDSLACILVASSTLWWRIYSLISTFFFLSTGSDMVANLASGLLELELTHIFLTTPLLLLGQTPQFQHKQFFNHSLPLKIKKNLNT